ncbi:hypothetical protein BASA50_001655 [Batrachochytrium salamandrivorans]|uniref:VHS domain-containing protein n=1 Tax=Batrachochytrium salamandrivorans TaxID=1357716 RepID=A0ABQ8FNM0_9FUNG|nr:hypothetical protein BASA50_001655 [Batrachochytrium salamandrivorans]
MNLHISGGPPGTQQVLSSINNLLYEAGMDQPGSMLEEMIAQACDPSFGHSALSLNLEICDLVNKTQKTYPRDCAFAILKHVNRGNNTAAYLALMLLDICVKNCGYPFHLVIGSKEFLNELVRRFPDKPATITATQHRILELLQLWNATLCVNSRYKEDFKHINDMYRLLSYKGYRFPELQEAVILSFNGEGQSLRTEEELEEEDRKAHGAKLEELIRKGTPAALAQANDLMKIMAGYDLSKKPDYKKEVNQEIERIESRIILLNDMLNQQRPGGYFRNDPTIGELHGAAKSAQNKLQSFIETNDDEDRLARLLELNDLINIVLQKHSDMLNGKSPQHNDLDRRNAEPAESNRPAAPTGPINLIDFDDLSCPPAHPLGADSLLGSMDQPATMQVPFKNPGIMDDLTSLSFGAPSGSASISSVQAYQYSRSLGDPAPISSAMQNTGALFQMQQGKLPASKSLHDATVGSNSLLTFGTSNSTMKPWTGISNSPVENPTTQMQQSRTADFGVDLLSGGVDLLSMGTNSSKMAGPQKSEQPFSIPSGFHKANDVLSGASNSVIMYDKNGLQIKLKIRPSGVPQRLDALAVFMNITPVSFADLNFQIAVPKPSGTTLMPFNQAQITQAFSISNSTSECIRLRFKLQYSINGATVNEIGEFAVPA